MAAATLESPALEIRLLGEPMVLRGGAPCPLPSSKKTRALLGYLENVGSRFLSLRHELRN